MEDIIENGLTKFAVKLIKGLKSLLTWPADFLAGVLRKYADMLPFAELKLDGAEFLAAAVLLTIAVGIQYRKVLGSWIGFYLAFSLSWGFCQLGVIPTGVFVFANGMLYNAGFRSFLMSGVNWIASTSVGAFLFSLKWGGKGLLGAGKLAGRGFQAGIATTASGIAKRRGMPEAKWVGQSYMDLHRDFSTQTILLTPDEEFDPAAFQVAAEHLRDTLKGRFDREEQEAMVDEVHADIMAKLDLAKTPLTPGGSEVKLALRRDT